MRMTNNVFENLYHQSLLCGFAPVGQEYLTEAPVNAAAYTLAKEEGTTLCLLQAADLSRVTGDIFKFLHDRELERAVGMAPLYSSVWVIFAWVGTDEEFQVVSDTNHLKFAMERAEAFYGQSPYAVYWRLDTEELQVVVPAGQPDDVMGLKSAVKASLDTNNPCNTSHESDRSIQDSNRTIHDNNSTLHDDNSASYENNNESHDCDSTSHEANNAAPVFTFMLAFANIAVMLLMYFQGYATMPIVVAARFGAIVPYLIWEAGEYYRLFTAMFVHFGWTHLFFNIAGILIFGTRIERYYNRLAYLVIYFISGLAASVASLILTRGVSAGASGAVYGLLGAAFVYTRYTKRPMDMINNHILMVYIIMGLAMGFVVPGIDYYGHIGGLIAGIFVGFIFVRLKGENRK